MSLADIFPNIGKPGCSGCGATVPDQRAAAMFGVVLCPLCEAENAALATHGLATRQRAEERSEQLRRGAQLSAVLSEIPTEYRGLTLESPELAQRVTRQKAIAEAFGWYQAPVVTIAGSQGSGKSTLASAMLGTMVKAALAGGKEARQLARDAHWVSCLDLIRDRARHPLGHGESPLVELCHEASLLVLDEMGLDPLKSEGAVYHVIYGRRSAGLHTIVTTGLPARTKSDTVGIGDWYGGGMLRRLTDDRAIVIQCSER